jgi:hypothetical protein
MQLQSLVNYYRFSRRSCLWSMERRRHHHAQYNDVPRTFAVFRHDGISPTETVHANDEIFLGHDVLGSATGLFFP